MESKNTPDIIDYARPRRRRLELRLPEVLAVMCFIAAIMTGLVAFVDFSRPSMTSQRLQYEHALRTILATRPSYVMPPYVGQSFVYPSPWSFGSTYVAIALAVLGAVLTMASTRSGN